MAPGLSHFTCDTCTEVLNRNGERPLCMPFDRVLKTNADGKPLRCAECLLDTRSDLND
jgi:hypothetical protein